MKTELERIQIKALKESIEHWKENTKIKNIKDAKIGIGYCACCEHFYKDDCEDCPIAIYTGERYCRNTPYELVEDAYADGRLEDFIKSAKKELLFLKDVLEYLNEKEA